MKFVHLITGCTVLGLLSSTASADTLTGQDIAEKVWNRDIGDARINTLSMTLINKNGQTRQRTAKSFALDSETISKTAIFFSAPTSIADTVFLSWDYEIASKTDKQWLYLPVTQRTRTIPASERGDAFMGTDFSYEDIKSNLRLDLNDYRFKVVDSKSEGDKVFYTIEAVPRTDKTSRELGYGRAVADVDSSNWLIVKATFTDPDGAPLKEIHVKETEEIDGVWTATNVQALNLQTGHSTVFELSDVTYTDKLDDEIFDKDSIEFGAPDYD